MIRIKTMKQIATSSAIPGVRSLRALGRSHQLWLDCGRMTQARCQIMASEAHRQWRNQMWK
ncbi:MAG: hypothetical protein VKL39_09235 [Leptolyngbyaceae bacterium]|nr:hypothetical protein [Leptolyngbyaceae bacterium]